MSFSTITDGELVNLGVTGLPDTPELTTEEMQAQFDEYPQFLKDKFKTHITELEANTAASDIGATVPDELTDVTTEKVQDILDGLAGMQSTHSARTDNPHSVTKAQVGLGDVPNVTTDNQTPTVSEAAEYANLAEGDTLAVIVGKIKKAISTLTSHMANASNPHSVTKAQVGLGNADNTADTDKPISTATQTALDGKAPTSHASANTTYGLGTGSNYGHVKLSDTYDPETPGEASDGIAASQKAVKDLFARTLEEIQQAGWGDMLRTVYDPDKDGVIGLAQGGTGQTTAAGVRNALGLGNTTDALPVANGGTGATTVAGARNALGLGNTADELPVANGGTGAANAADARSNLGAASQEDCNAKAEKDDLTNIDITGSTNDTGATITKETFFYLNGDLVRAKADVANGATFTLNTNYEVVTAGGLNKLQSDLATVKSSLANYIITAAKSIKNVACSANSATGTSVDITLANYIPIGIMGVAGDNSFIDIRRYYLDGNDAKFVLWNTASTAITVSEISFVVLYKHV